MPKERTSKLLPSEEVFSGASRLPAVGFLINSLATYKRHKLENRVISVFEDLNTARQEDDARSIPAVRTRFIGRIVI